MSADNFVDNSASTRAEFGGVMVVDAVVAAAGKPKTLYITGAFYTGYRTCDGCFQILQQTRLCFRAGEPVVCAHDGKIILYFLFPVAE
jgi:hypothetical protein